MPDQCPSCGHTWLGDEITVGLLKTGCYSLLTAVEAAAQYGWTPENRKRFNEHVLFIEPMFSRHNFWLCLKCEKFHHWYDGEYVWVPREIVNDILHDDDTLAVSQWLAEHREEQSRET